MKEKKEKRAYNSTKASYIVRILAGFYLLYLVYQMMIDWESCTGFTLVASILGMIAFVVCGIGFISYSIYALHTGRYAGGALDFSEENGND